MSPNFDAVENLSKCVAVIMTTEYSHNEITLSTYPLSSITYLSNASVRWVRPIQWIEHNNAIEGTHINGMVE